MPRALPAAPWAKLFAAFQAAGASVFSIVLQGTPHTSCITLLTALPRRDSITPTSDVSLKLFGLLTISALQHSGMSLLSAAK
jgi:hypothetical protein